MVLQAWKNGICLSSSSDNGIIMTRCMIKEEFFVEKSYKIEVNYEKEADIGGERNQSSQGRGPPLVELCLPIFELKQIIDSLEKETITLKYPVDDARLQVEFPEDNIYGSPDDKVQSITKLCLETYQVSEN